MLPVRRKSSGFGTASRTISRVGLPARHRLGEAQRQPEVAVAEAARDFAQPRLELDPLAQQLLLTPAVVHACTQQEAMEKGTKLSQIVQTKMAQDPAQGQALMVKLQPIMIANQGEMASGGTIDWNKVLRSVRCSYPAGTVKARTSVFRQIERVGLRWSQYYQEGGQDYQEGGQA